MTFSGESARSLLFVPADRPDRFDKAAESGADGIILDLEDGVAPAAKGQARRHAVAWLSRRTAMLRINAADTQWFDDDIALVRAIRCPVMIPKIHSARQIADILQLVPRVPAIVLLETAAGIANAADICAVPGVLRAAFGSVDLGAELGIDSADRDAMAYARGAVIVASAANELPPPLDGVCVDVVNTSAVAAEAQHAAALGFGGKLCIHPRQVAPINYAFSPSANEVAWARTIMAAGETGGVTVVDGRMVDRPIVRRARRLLNQAGEDL